MAETETKPRAYVPSSFVIRCVVNPITLWLGGPTLVVPGRRSGRQIRTPVPTSRSRRTYLVSGGGETH